MTIDEYLLGYFPRESAREPEAFTGERLTSAIGGQVAIEHYHRYLFARAFCQGRDVVDVASGEGYGSAQLSQVARQVIGVEYSWATAWLAARNFARDNLRFINADARFLPLPGASADVVVSFETIEHFAGQEAFVADVRRVLRPDGCFIVSTPDRDNYAPTGVATNTHHIRELSRPEFDALLGRHFRYRHFLYQRPLIGSALLAETESAGVPLVFERREVERFEATIGLPRPVYIVAIASNAPLPALPNSLYIERSDLDTDGADKRRALANLAETRVALARAEARGAELTAQRDAVEAERAGWERRAGAAEHVAGSLRSFLRQYLPRLRAHWSRR